MASTSATAIVRSWPSLNLISINVWNGEQGILCFEEANHLTPKFKLRSRRRRAMAIVPAKVTVLYAGSSYLSYVT